MTDTPTLHLGTPIDLDRARASALAAVSAGGSERVPLTRSRGRVSAGGNLARLDVPGFDQSTRDGYAVRGVGRDVGGTERAFVLRGEIRAGPAAGGGIEEGEACRIMTGGCVPDGAERVVPQEHCRVLPGEVVIDAGLLAAVVDHIQRCGSDCRRLDEIAPAGTAIAAGQVVRLAAAGIDPVEVYRRPRVAFFCTGSELVETAGQVRLGEKVSANRYLLDMLIERHGGEGFYYGIVTDERRAIMAKIEAILAAGVDAVISTGGVGPGKYDLVAAALEELGASVLYRALAIRPGRSTIAAAMGDTVFFGLPGPPLAVTLLFQEILGPVLEKMAGHSRPGERRVEAVLEEELSVIPGNGLHFVPGVYRCHAGRLRARRRRVREVENCFLVISREVSSYPRGGTVQLSILTWPPRLP